MELFQRIQIKVVVPFGIEVLRAVHSRDSGIAIVLQLHIPAMFLIHPTSEGFRLFLLIYKVMHHIQLLIVLLNDVHAIIQYLLLFSQNSIIILLSLVILVILYLSIPSRSLTQSMRHIQIDLTLAHHKGRFTTIHTIPVIPHHIVA